MTASKSSSRFRVGRVSYYQHHGSWYLYFRNGNIPHRTRVGRSQAEAERAAAVKNAELVTGQVSNTPGRVIRNVMLMKQLLLFVVLLTTWATNVRAITKAGKGENVPVVHSFVDGRYYIRSTPDGDYGTAGKTEVFRVKKDDDELIGEYGVYMRGELFLGWLPTAGKWAIVQLEPERIVSPDERHKIGDVSRLVFYVGGKKIREYTKDDLANLGLVKRYARLVQPGSFTVQGVAQVPRTNRYVFTVTRQNEKSKPEVSTFDVATGEIVEAKQGGGGQTATAVKSKAE